MIRQLHHLITHTAMAVRHGIHDFEYDPTTQWHYHLRMSWFWVANLPFVTYMLVQVLGGDDHTKLMWTAIMLGVNTYYSLYANFCTEFGGVHAAFAALKGVEISTKQDIAKAEKHIVSEIDELKGDL